jgi:hypothetical protein
MEGVTGILGGGGGVSPSVRDLGGNNSDGYKTRDASFAAIIIMFMT